MIGTFPTRLLRLSLLLLVIAVSLSAAFPVGRASAQGNNAVRLTVDPGTSEGEISRYVYGINHGPWALVPVDLWPQAQDAGLTYLRFPAGNWGDRNDLKPYHIDMFMKFAELLGAEPAITVRIYKGTPEKAAELVRYTNIEKKYGVRYWSVGNEPNLLPDEFPDSPSREQLIKDWRAIAEAMLAVDPTIQFIGPEVHQYPYGPDAPQYMFDIRDWLVEFLRQNGDLISVVSIHRYPFPVGQNAPATTIQQLKATTSQWDWMIPDLRDAIREATGRDIPVAVTEVNSHWNKPQGGEASVESHYNAIWWSDVLGRLIRQKVFLVTFWTLATSGDLGGHGILDRYNVRPTYYVYQMYKRLGEELLSSSSDNPDVTITAARRADGALTLMVINLSTEERLVSFHIDGLDSTAAAETWLFDPTHNAVQVSSDTVLDGGITLAGQSVTLYVITQ